jgi:hypothetical protein
MSVNAEPPDLDAITARAQYAWSTVPLDTLGPMGDQLLRKDIPALVAEVRRLQQEVRRLTSENAQRT